MKQNTVRETDPDFDKITSFSPADIRNYTALFNKEGRQRADEYAKKRYLEVRLTKLRLTSMFEHIIGQNSFEDIYSAARSAIITVSEEGLYPFSLAPARDYVFDFRTLNDAFGIHLWQNRTEKTHDARILRNIHGCRTLLDFHKECADDDVQVSFDICEKIGALKSMDFIVDGVEVDRSDVTPIYLALLGIRYNKSEQWEQLHDLAELQEAIWT